MKRILILMIALFPMSAFAGYNANFRGKLTQVLTYTYTTQILIQVEGQPTTHPECTSLDYLVLPASMPDNVRQLVMSRLMTAYATGEQVNIGYDKDSSCVNGRIQVFRVG
jgi:hypothetical protein